MWKKIGIGLGVVGLLGAAGLGGAIVVGMSQTAALHDGMADKVFETVAKSPPTDIQSVDLKALPDPVQRYFQFAFKKGPRSLQGVRMEMAGDFRRPGSDSWAPMAVRQYVSSDKPAFVFTGRTHVIPGIWADAMDSYVDGVMHMAVHVLSTVNTLNELDVPALNDVTKMRFFLEAPLFPTALLPSEHLRWEAIDQEAALAVVLRNGNKIGGYRVTFGEDGRILRYDAEESEPIADESKFHGAGEIALRSGYQEIDGVMVPTKFEIARRIDGVVKPFWRGSIKRLEFGAQERFN